ncbi:MAG TPA: SUF system NifU family Fe-S cluster assembly protein, partial [Candidatus Sulfotelmatobacter sp.]|nr:SUF system NifU family Fe-S cluster assembly protein [Candidatus Sulfotelmatobacter sp.]
MSDLRELYQQVILDHYKRPRNFQRLESANRRAEGHNPLCGDEIVVYLRMNGDVIEDISFEGAGCAISKASASMMTAALKGKTRAEAEEIFAKFHEMVTGNGSGKVDPLELGKLAVFCGVSEFPVRVKCASLAWHTLNAALDGKGE